MIMFFIVLCAPALWADRLAWGGTTLERMSGITEIVKIRNEREIVRIIEMIRAAREMSARALSREEIAKILRMARETLDNQAGMIIDAGAMVYTGSFEIE